MNLCTRRWLLSYATIIFTAVLGIGTLVQGSTLGPTATAATGPTLAISGASTTEGNFGSKTLRFTVRVTGTHSRITAGYSTADGSATAGSDYTAVAGTLTINSWQSSATVSVTVRADRVYEPNETFTVTLSNPVNATITTGTATGTITNDDPAPPPTTTSTTTTTTTSTTTSTTTTTTAQPALGTVSLSMQAWTDAEYGAPSGGRVTSDPPGIDCVVRSTMTEPVTCSGTFPSGSVTLRQVPDPDSVLWFWTIGRPGEPNTEVSAATGDVVVQVEGSLTTHAGIVFCSNLCGGAG